MRERVEAISASEERSDAVHASRRITRHASSSFRLLMDDAHGPAWNMAVDEAILDAVGEGIAPPTIRFYTWDSPAVSIGRFQDAARDVDLEYCGGLSIPIVRRPTGGRGILHGWDQTVSIVVPETFIGEHHGSVGASYRWLSGGLLAGLESLGVVVKFGPCVRIAKRAGDCFAVRSQADIVTTAGEKLIGSAQRRSGGVILQQSSIRFQRPDLAPQSVFRGAASGGQYPLEGLEEQWLVAALLRGLRDHLLSAVTPGYLSAWEEERAAVLCSGGRLYVPRVDLHQAPATLKNDA